MSVQPKHKYSVEEYLELDRKSEARLEYWHGEVFDMSGVSPEHDAIEGNVYHYLRQRMEGRKCRAFLANMRIKVPGAPPYRYADLSALCGQPLYETIGGLEILTNPSLIVEILSESTEAYDRGDKFTYYKSIPSFCEYLLIAQHRPHITHFIRLDDMIWNHREYNDPASVVKLVSVDCELAMHEVYENLIFDESIAHPHLRPIE
ncbi:MAG: Uma2 family endonuclease [Acidobacteria bacterium]|nr:Uma2 family endonuclease [Acidobacteriota bacterium]